MHRPGCDPESMTARDFVCDFCGQCWEEKTRPMVEGHRGSLICGSCLTLACRQVLVRNSGLVVPEHVACTLCLMNKTGDYWQSPVLAQTLPTGDVDVLPQPGACVCRWCIEKSAGMLEKDADAGWQRPRE